MKKALDWLVSLGWAVRWWWVDRKSRKIHMDRQRKFEQQWAAYFAQGGRW